jgi:hypothetical protein
MKQSTTVLVLVLGLLFSARSFAQVNTGGQTTNGPCSPIFNGSQNTNNCTIVVDRGTLNAVQQGNTVVLTAVGGRVEPVSFGLIFDAEVTLVSTGVGTCMSCGDGRLNDSQGKPDKKTIWVFWRSPALLPEEPITLTFKSATPANLVGMVLVKMPI